MVQILGVYQTLVVQNADKAGSLVEAVEWALLNDTVEGIADKVALAAYIHMEDRTADDIAHVVVAYLDRDNDGLAAASQDQICSHLTLWAQSKPPHVME